MSSPGYVQLVFPIPVEGPFDYRIPPALRGQVAVGQRIRAPFGRLRKVGYAVRLLKDSSAKNMKEIEALLDPEPLLPPSLFELAKFLSHYYLCSLGEALEAILPVSLQARKRLPPSQTAPSAGGDFSVAQLKDLLPQFERFRKGFEGSEREVFLLWDTPEKETSSFYLEAVRVCLAKGRSAIVLCPEIHPAEVLFRFFQKSLGETVALWHGALSPLQRYESWVGMREGRIKVVVGTRSALFAPLEKVGLIVLDSEEDPSYKQEEMPRYHARDVALFRADKENALLLLQSPTPSLESFTHALAGRYQLLHTDSPKKGGSVRVIPMGEHSGKKRRILFSKPLELRLEQLLRAGGKGFLFLNRRGFATFIHCRKCGTVFRCPECQVAYRYHFKSKKLLCHYCSRRAEPPDICPKCQAAYVSYAGTGTEKVESELQRLFPTARIGRLDLDIAGKRQRREEIVQAMKKGELDLLVGTQLLAKEGVSPGVDLVAVLSAETHLNQPDFRSAERAFSLFYQLFNRLKDEGPTKELLIQTFYSDHPVFRALKEQDYQSFYKEEIVSRKSLHFPPFYSLAAVVFQAKKEERVKEAAQKLKDLLKQKRGVLVSGPAPCAVRRQRGSYQWQLLVKSKKSPSEALSKALAKLALPSSIRTIVDIDPQ